MNKYWVSWYSPNSEFTLYRPWWVSGESCEGLEIICAALIADDEESAKEQIFETHDNRPSSIDFRFVNERPSDWSPFNARFPKAKWMDEYWPGVMNERT